MTITDKDSNFFYYANGDKRRIPDPEAIEAKAEARQIHPDELAKKASQNVTFLGRECDRLCIESGVIILLPKNQEGVSSY